MNIAFDVDGVVLNSIDHILEHINRVMGRNITQAQILGWDLENLGVDFSTLWDGVLYMYEKEYIEPYDGAVDVLARIHRTTGKPLLFITGRSDPETARRQLLALKWNPEPPEMIVTGGDRDKRAFLAEWNVDFIVEDDIKHAEDYMKAGIGFGLMLRPWNRSAASSVTKVFRGWKDVEEWFFDSQETVVGKPLSCY